MLSEIHIIGERTRERIVSQDMCPALRPHRIGLCGVSEARSPYRMARPRMGFSEMVVGLAGTGLVLVDGAWRELAPGEAYLSVAGQDECFHPPPGRVWKFVWLHLWQDEATPYISARGPRVKAADGAPLAQTIEALRREVLGPNDPSATVHLSALLALYARRIGRGSTGDERLWRVWRAVDAEPDRPWTLMSLAGIACMSPEHLRRQCRGELGKSPMAQVTDLRMQRAAALLRLGSTKVETIAVRVGYGSVYAFSTAFKRWVGQAPSDYRAEARLETAAG